MNALFGRRRLLRAGMAWAASAALAPPARAQFQFASEVRGDLVRLAPDVYAYRQRVPEGQSDFAVANCGLLAGGRRLTAIDATAAPLHARRFIDEAMRATGKSFGRMIYTHFHGDHVHGTALFDDVEVIAHQQCRELMVATRSQQRPAGWLARASWAQGDEPFKLLLPTRTYTDSLELHDEGPNPVRLLWPGPAHTAGDTIVHLPREKIAFIGDIGFFGITPLLGNAYSAGWIAACDRILAMDVDVLVPGHGDIGGKPQLERFRDYLVLIRRAARAAYDAGVPAGRAAARVELGSYADWPDADRIADNFARLYAEFDGSAGPLRDAAAAARAQRDFQETRRQAGAR